MTDQVTTGEGREYPRDTQISGPYDVDPNVASAPAPATAAITIRANSPMLASQSSSVTIIPESGPRSGVIPGSIAQIDDLATDAKPDSEDDGDFELTTEQGRSKAVASYTKRFLTNSRPSSAASLARTALVDPADLTKWKKGLLPPGSVKAHRIENVLSHHKPPTPAPTRKADA